MFKPCLFFRTHCPLVTSSLAHILKPGNYGLFPPPKKNANYVKTLYVWEAYIHRAFAGSTNLGYGVTSEQQYGCRGLHNLNNFNVLIKSDSFFLIGLEYFTIHDQTENSYTKKNEKYLRKPHERCFLNKRQTSFVVLTKDECYMLPILL